MRPYAFNRLNSPLIAATATKLMQRKDLKDDAAKLEEILRKEKFELLR